MRDDRSFEADVNNPEYRRIEDLVFAYLQDERGWEVRDARGRKGHWDFEVKRQGEGPMLTLDVKADTYMDSTVRVPFENRLVFDDGTEREGWGWYTDLDVMAFVGVDTMVCYFVRLRTFRELIEQEWLQTGRVPRGWRAFKRRTNSRTDSWLVRGWAVPFEELLRANAIYHVAQLPQGGI